LHAQSVLSEKIPPKRSFAFHGGVDASDYSSFFTLYRLSFIHFTLCFPIANCIVQKEGKDQYEDYEITGRSGCAVLHPGGKKAVGIIINKVMQSICRSV